jgi:hypothetical protein
MVNNPDPYAPLAAELDQVLAEQDPRRAAAGLRRCQLTLARAASGANFDPRRHRAIAAAIRDASRGGAPDGPMRDDAIAPLTTRDVR